MSDASMQHFNCSYESILIELLQTSMISKGTQSVRVRLSLIDKCRDICEREGYSINDFVNTALAEKLAKELSENTV